jgi:sugar phosphate isomerase/epimerase
VWKGYCIAKKPRDQKMNMKILQVLTVFFAVAVGNAGSVNSSHGNPFFAMDTALNDGKSRTAAEQAALLKEFGFDGLGATGYPSDEFLAAFEKERLKVFNTYLTLNFDSSKPGLDPKLKEFLPRSEKYGVALWISVKSVVKDGQKFSLSAEAGDDVVVPRLRKLAVLAESKGIKIALYPHARQWIERFEDALRVATKVNRPNVGATFNLCHWLAVEGNRDPNSVLQEALSRLSFVSINGADVPNGQKPDWSKLIQPLDAGTFDVTNFVKSLKALGYNGPIGFQGYGIRGDSREILSRSMAAWRKMNASAAQKK